MEQDPKENFCVFLVDDEADIRTSLSRALGLRGYKVEAFESAASFLAVYDKRTPGCLVLDYGMPDMDGLMLQKHLRENGVEIPTIFITGHGGVPESVQAMKMGALDFLEKPFKQSVLIERIEAAFDVALARYDQNQQSQALQARLAALTDREREIAHLMVTNAGRNSSKDIARDLDISPRTVDHHRARILEKMEVGSVAELVQMWVQGNVASER